MSDPRKPEPPADFEGIEAPRLEIAIGLLEAKHRIALGPAWHLYLYILSRKAFRSPFVAKGKPIPLWLMAFVEGVSERTIDNWLARLRRRGYIATTRKNCGGHDKSKSGVIVRILKAKEWRRGRMRVFAEARAQKVALALAQHLAPAVVVQGSATSGSETSPPKTKILPRRKKTL